MSFLRQKYKEKSFGFGNIKEGRSIRAEKQRELRKHRRANAVMENRNILNASTTSESKEVPDNVQRLTIKLLKWKSERDRHKRMEQAKRRPPFIVGLVHHKLYSPASKDENIFVGKALNRKLPVASTPPPKRITRATQKRLLNKMNAQSTITPVTTVSNSNATKKQKAKKNEQKQETTKKQEPSFAPPNYKFKLSTGLLFGRVPIGSMSPMTLSSTMLSSSRMTRASKRNSKRNSTAKFTGDKFNDQQYNASAIFDKKKGTNVMNKASVEITRLNVSYDQKKTSNTLNDNDNMNNTITIDDKNDSKKREENNKLCNNSTKESHITLNNNAKGALSSSNSNKPTSAHSDSLNKPVFFSPYVVSSRGKSIARKEQQLKRGLSLNSSGNDDIPTKDTVMKNLNISIEEEERTAQYFQFLLNKEIDRLSELCEKWEKVKAESTEIAEDAQYQINQAVGQTNLLITKKFERFRNLISDCETGKGEMLVTCRDLQGFWDMMYMEVKNCDLRFEKLERLCSRNWEEEESSVIVKPLVKKKTAAIKKVVPTRSSSIRAFLAKNKKKQETSVESSTKEAKIISNEVSIDKHGLNESSPNVKYKRRSIAIDTSGRKLTPAKYNRTRMSQIQKVQLSETKKLTSPLVVIKISRMCKTPESSYLNSTQTPGKSILKLPKDSIEVEPHSKITHKVNFDDTITLNEISTDEEKQRDTDLTTARIDNFNFDCSEDGVSIHAAKKLNFNDNGINEPENIFDEMQDSEKENTSVPTIQIQSATPLHGSVSNNNLNASRRRRNIERQNAFDENDEISDETTPLNTTVSIPFKEITDVADLNILEEKSENHMPTNDEEKVDNANESARVLRTKTVTQGNLPQHKRRSLRILSLSVKESEHKENKIPLETRRSSSINIKDNDKIDSKIDLEDALDNMSLNQRCERRRSRRSVKFIDCSVCIETKPVLPMTPHVRRSKTQSKEKVQSMYTEGDVPEETSAKAPTRVRRSRNRKVSSVNFE
ncbi:disks large-associated protein 5-like isoform X2 [Colletes gigas]|uniref:disks large-associated protein 5-like isoform X2 n=1 Tax=Colletes gigas TaxID=935657 RepID=UPI001C9B8F7C|nr:disks large-associated protein 5-like isoform X2 [Colletes gigas]